MENSIIPLRMLLHSSHLLQPLDVGCFKSPKNTYRQEIAENMRLGINHIDKQVFLVAYQQARPIALSQSNIQSGFATTGLVPPNLSQVLSRLKVQIRTPTPPSSNQGPEGFIGPMPLETPYNVI